MSAPALSQRTLTALAAAGITPSGWRWRSRPSIPRPGGQAPWHRRLNGRVFATMPAPGERGPVWPSNIRHDGRDGDHKGCRCQAVPALRSADGRFAPQRLGADDG